MRPGRETIMRNMLFWPWRIGAVLASLCPTIACAQAGLEDPAGSGSLVASVGWLQAAMLGTTATLVAIIAVASIGFAMLTGRLNGRHATTVILGCFILFGAPTIAAGIMRAVQGEATQTARFKLDDTSPLPAAIAAMPKAPPGDPYAGASLRRR